MYGRNHNCFGCRETEIARFAPRDASIQYVDVPCAHGYMLSYAAGNHSVPELYNDFGDRGVYRVAIARDAILVTQAAPPYNSWLPIVVAALVYLGMIGLFCIGYFLIYKRCIERPPPPPPHSEDSVSLLINTEDTRSVAEKKKTDDPVPSGGVIPRSTARLFSVDTFRGISLAVMVFVNYNGGSYWFFNHSVWNGLTLADLVFPWFIFLMGVSISLSLSSILSRPVVWTQLMYKIIRRTIILFALGLIINNCFIIEQCRVPGVLQRFAVSYLFCTLIVIFVPRIHLRYQDSHRFENLRQIYVDRLFEWIIVLLFVATWVLVTFLLPVPGCPTGYLGPGGKLLNLYECTGGAAGYIDRLVFGSHIYLTPTCQITYQTTAYDPEGLLGCLTSIFITYLGVHCGRIFVAYRKTNHKLLYLNLLICGAVLSAIGGALCGFSQNDGVIPVAKNLWSLSFVLVMGGTGFLFLALFHQIIDVRSWWNGAPFRYMGMNSIAIYCSHEIMGAYFPFQWDFANTHGASLLCSLVGVSLWVLIAYYMHVIKFYVKI